MRMLDIGKCERCDKFFTRKYSVRTHFKMIHEKTEAERCDLCGKSYVSKGYLKTHMETVHVKMKAYKCDSCDKSDPSVKYCPISVVSLTP